MAYIAHTVRVAAIFEPSGVRPVWFALGSRKYPVEQTTYRWQDRDGSALRLHFTITSGSGLYELVYHTEAQSWELTPLADQ